MRNHKFFNNNGRYWATVAFLLALCMSSMVAAQTVTTSVITNSGFESALSGWAPSRAGTIGVKVNATKAHSGSDYLEVTATSGQHPVVFAAPTSDTYIAVQAGEVVNFGGYAYRVSGDGLARFMLIAYDSNKANPKYISPTPNNASGAMWVNQLGTYVVPTGIGFVRLYAEVYQPTVSTTVRFDDAVLTGTLPAPKAPTITWSTPADITYGTALSGTQLNATSSTPGTFAYSPASGAILNAGTQTLSVTFTPTDTTNYTSATKSVTINVSKAASTLIWATPSDITYGTALSGTQLNAASSTPGTFAYSPAWGAILNAGSQTLSVTFTPTDTANYTSATKSVTINVSKAASTLTWSTPSDIVYGTALSGTQLNATASTPGSFVYSPASGAMLSAGTQALSVTFTPTDTTNYTSATKTVTINVSKAASTLTWTNPSDITYGSALSGTQLNATSSAPGTFAYTPASGAILNAGSQTLSVTFTPTDTTNYTSATKSVTINVNKAASTLTWASPSDIIYGTALSGTQLNATASTPGTFAYTPASGAILNAGSQTLSVTFTPTDTTNYTSATKSVTINVSKAASTISWTNPSDITYGTALSGTQLNATSSTPGTFAYTPASGAILNAGTQTLSVNFTPTDTTNYTSATKSVTINVTKAASPITWSNPADITYGTALSGVQLNATSTVAGAFAYSPAAGTVLKAGAGQTLTATFTPTDSNFTVVTKSVTINVGKGMPVIVWSNPADITYGTALNTTQLNATSTLPGKFAYTPAVGTVLSVGTAQVLSTTFTPTDITNYSTATKTVTINVNSGTTTNKLLLGIRYGDNGLNMTALKDLETWQAKKNAVVLTFTAWCNTSSYMDAMFGQQMTNLWNNRNIPVVTWQAYLCSNQTTPADIEGRAANGEYDAYFTAWAARMKKWLAGPDGVYGTSDDRRAYLRMPHEMNGNWYPWSPTAPGEAPWQYAEMWRHIHSIFEIQGIDSVHLQWMFTPNASGPYAAEDFYPGDAYVDWVGLDGYNFGAYSGGKWMTPAQRLDNMLGRLKLLTSKPIALAETGSSAYTSTGVSYAAKDQWMKDVFTYASQKNIRMVMYFNKDVGADFMMFGGPEGTATYTSGTTTYNVFPGYKQAVSPTWVMSSDPNNPRLLTDSQFAGQF